MTPSEQQTGHPAHGDEERRAYHEAAHAVAMWKLGYGILHTTIDADKETSAHTKRARCYDLDSEHDPRRARYIVEQNALVLHAGSVAEQLLRPGSNWTDAGLDHERIHQEMSQVEDDGSVHITWCNYLWQRAYTLLAWPRQWKLIVALARVLLTYRTLDGASAELCLKRVDELLEHDPSIPNMVLIGEVTYVCSPWHRKWHSTSVDNTPPAKRTALPEAVEGWYMTELRPLRSVLGPLSGRAQGVLDLCNIRTPFDLSRWSERGLSSVRGAGKKTVSEILEASARAGIQLARHDAPDSLYSDGNR
jgi:hypothetical protein